MNRQMRRLIVSLCFAAAMLLAGGWFGVQPVYAADGMTRAEWIHNLTQVFEMTVEGDNYPDNYYSDITAANSCYRDIMVATEFGVIEVEAGQKICPDDALTREFAAYTLNYCLGFKLEDETYTYSDVDRVTDKYRPDVQIALNRGWFTLINGEFLPETPVTASEAGVMLNDAKLWIDATKIDESHRNSFEYDSEYIEVPRETSVEVDEDGLVKIYDETVSISKGDKFIVYQNELPQAFKAGTVEIIGDVIHITTEQLDINEALTEADAQGVSESDLGLVEPADGVDVYYEEETETVEFAEPSSMSYNSFSRAMMRAISGNKKVKSVKLSKKIGGNCKVDAKLSSLRVEYRIDGINDIYVAVTGDAQVTATGSFSNSGTSSITLGTINVGGIADVKIQAKMLVTGKIVITYGTDFTAGVHYTAGGFRLVKSFHKKSFTIASEIQMTTGLEASVNVDKIPGIRGKIYAEIGAKTTVSSKMRPSGNPSLCMHVVSYLYAQAGASVTFGVSGFSKTFSKKAVIFNEKNSPVRVVWHYEDGVLKGSGCSIDPDWNYYTGLESRYGINSSGYGIDGSGEIVPIFTYTLDDDGNATITGYKGNSYLVAIPDEIDGHPVIAIGSNAFKENRSFSELVVPEGVTTIGDGAFKECKKLTKATLPESLTVLYNGVFWNCTSLSEVNIPSKLEVRHGGWGGPFTACAALKNITFNTGITTISNYLFEGCNGLEEIGIPETVTTIQGSAFANCTNLAKVNIPETVTTIGAGAFKECKKLTKVTLPESLTVLYNGVFWNCTSLSEVNIPSKLEVRNGGWGGPFTACAALKNITFNTGITTISNYLFEGCNGLEEIGIPETVTTIQGSAFANCTNLAKVNIPETVTTIEDGAFKECKKLTKVTLPESLTVLYNGVFWNCTSLSEVNIPSKLEVRNGSWGGPFTACAALKNITFNTGITTISNYLFEGCSGLEEVEIPETVTTIQRYAFSNCTNLTEINIPVTVKNLGDDVFSGCTSLKKAHIPEDWTEIPSGTFNGCTILKEVNLPKNLTKVGANAFKECDALEEVTFPEKLQFIDGSAYYGCSALKKITFPSRADGTISIRNSVFGKCEALTDVTLSENVSEIGSNAFEYCVALEKITLPDSLRSLGDSAFQYCEALADVELGAGLTEIPQYCFLADRSLVTIVCPQQMTKVEANAFKNATSFREITLNRRITSIDSTAFSYPAKLTIYGITGTYPETFAKEQDITFVPLNSPATAIRLNQGEYRLARGDSFQLTASITPANSSDELVWKSLNEDVVTVSETGMLKGISLGTAKVTATAGTVTVISEITVYEKVTGVSLDSSSKTVTAGESFWLTATVWPKEASDKSVIWRSSDENVVKVGATGCVSAVSAGKATIEVITVDGSYKKTCSVTVNDNPEPSETPAVSPAPTPSSKPSPTPGKQPTPTPEKQPTPTPGNFQDLSLKEDSALNITSDGKLTGLIQNENTVLEILEQFEAEELVAADADGNVLTETALLGTGATISILEGNTVKASCKVILAGDTNGDGKVNGKDISRLARSLVGKENLTEEQQTAADVWEDGALNGKDVSKMARSLVGKDTISSQKKPTETEEPTGKK